MNGKLKIRQTPDYKVWWTTDTHCFHEGPKGCTPLWESRGYKSPLDMTNKIIEVINSIVNPNDCLFHLGDITLNCSESQFEELLSRIRCQNIYMLFGNHNSPCWTIYQREVRKVVKSFGDETIRWYGIPPEWENVEIYPFRYRNLVFIGNYAEVTVDGNYFVLSHYPIHVWNKISHGAMHLTGHSHCGLDFSQKENLNAKILDIGWDGFGKPLSTEEVLNVMNKKTIFKTGDHHS